MSEHRVSMLGASWRRFEDPIRSRDPRVRAVVGALATLPAPEPRPEFRAELRAQLVAITPRIVAEGAESQGATTPMVDIVPRPKAAAAQPAAARRARHNDSFVARLRRVPIGRPLTVVASLVTAFAMLLGGAVWMSQKSLPGDTLYGLKRASERLELATAGGDTAKARDHLAFAATRADEVRDLLGRASASAIGPRPQADGGVDPNTAKRIKTALSSADSDVKAAAELLGQQAVQDRSAKPLDTMKTWAPGQLTRLQQIAAAMPDPALRNRTESSADLVTAALVRAKTLSPKVGCGCLGSSGADDLGPKPCGTCPPPTGVPVTPGGQQPTTHVGPTTPAHAPHAAQTGSATGSAQPDTDPTTGGGPSTGETTTPTSGLHLPSLPLPTPTSLPVSVKSCGIGATLGPIEIGIGFCPIRIKISRHPGP